MGFLMGDESAVMTQEEHGAFCALSEAITAAVKNAGYNSVMDYILSQDVAALYKRKYPLQS